MVVRFVEIWRLSVAADTKRWSFAGTKAANLLPHDAGEDDVDLYGRIAALGLANVHLFVSVATGRSPNFSHQITTFLRKHDLYFSPSRKRRVSVSKDTKRRSFASPKTSNSSLETNRIFACVAW